MDLILGPPTTGTKMPKKPSGIARDWGGHSPQFSYCILSAKLKYSGPRFPRVLLPQVAVSISVTGWFSAHNHATNHPLKSNPLLAWIGKERNTRWPILHILTLLVETRRAGGCNAPCQPFCLEVSCLIFIVNGSTPLWSGFCEEQTPQGSTESCNSTYFSWGHLKAVYLFQPIQTT
jgi:hypothetical protein